MVKPLTPRQLDILRLVAAGKTDKQIAQMLHIAERTMRYDLQLICDQLGVNTRIEAVAQALRLELIA